MSSPEPTAAKPNSPFANYLDDLAPGRSPPFSPFKAGSSLPDDLDCSAPALPVSGGGSWSASMAGNAATQSNLDEKQVTASVW
jgi:hypothetical protein